MNLLREIEKIKHKGERAALCTIVQSKGSTPRKVGTKMIVLNDRSIIGTIGGGNLEKEVITNAMIQIELNKPQLFKHDLLQQHNMCCGGSVQIFIEPIHQMNKLYIFGAGHTGHALARFASELDFDIYLIDDRKEYLEEISLDGLNKMKIDYKEVLPSLPFDDNTFITIMTYDHAHDRDILAYCLGKPNAYLGMIGSKRKIEITKKNFLEAKIADDQTLESIDMPMGLEIDAETPEEIAISILAKLIAIKNKLNA